MKVYKFGGASVTDASGIRNLAGIISEEKDNLAIVVSAFGKTTNDLEQVVKYWFEGNDIYSKRLDEIYFYHQNIIIDLFTQNSSVESKLSNSLKGLKDFLLSEIRRDYDFVYDQVVSHGELWSTIVIAEYLKLKLSDVEWIDIRGSLLTDNRYRDANIIWSESEKKIRAVFDFSRKRIYVTQGFIGGTVTGQTTTLGREGSDFTAAIIANIMDAECVVFWKDVPGILNADPKWFADAQPFDEISYKEAVEMTFSGAKVIHPKTIKPLHNKNIPLYVRSFLDFRTKGTVIKAEATLKMVLPVYIRKEDQMLISISPKDFSFVMGDNLSMVFHAFMTNGIKVNLVQASAVSINVCVDDERSKVDNLIDNLKEEYSTIYNDKVELLSIRHYSPEAIEKITRGREILLEQRTRSTVRYVVRVEPGNI